jgi:hypothetical protein
MTEIIAGPNDNEHRASLLDGIEDDLIQINDAGDGSREYELVDGVLYVNHYWDDQLDHDGVPIPNGRYRVRITVERVGGDS